MNPILTTSAAATAAALTAGAWCYAALYPNSQLFGPVTIAGRDPNELALTYDDGPNPAATPQLLDLLAKHNVQATFFLIGRFVREQPQLTRAIAAAGHRIGNHTMTHPWLAFQSAARIHAELTDCSHLLEDTLGAPITLFRPPHGARRPEVFRTAEALRMKTIQWNVTSYDWVMPKPGKPMDHAANTTRILTHIHRGLEANHRKHRASNILLHDGSDIGLNADRLSSIAATEQIILAGHQQGRRFVTPDTW
jgi:peptidoglycan/xylan/chitin deacetylase (PgdA/CDA1 family)